MSARTAPLGVAYFAQRDAAREMLKALREIVKDAPEEDPGESQWDSLQDAFDAGLAAQAWSTAQTARAAIAAAEAAGITEDAS